jgi:hypothetical protein
MGFVGKNLGRTALWLLVFGATLGPTFDGFHTFSGTLWYAHPQLLRSVWWCPPLFAGASLAIGLSRVLLDLRLEGRVLRPGAGAVAWKLAMFVLGYALSGFMPGPWWLKLAVLLALFVASLWPSDTRAALLSAATAALGGWAVEWLLTSHGLFSYRDPQLAGLPGWLPALYTLAAVATGAIARAAFTSSPSR